MIFAVRVCIIAVAKRNYNRGSAGDAILRLKGKRKLENKLYDVAILGAGPAGLSAGIYAARARLTTLIIDKGIDGGQIAVAHEIENYPGQAGERESGRELTARMAAQAARFGCERVTDFISSCELDGSVKTLHGAKSSYRAKTLILCTGAITRRIGCVNEDKYIGRGVSYCAVCDAAFFEGLDIYSVGGSSIALEEALFLSKFGRRVTVIHKGKSLSASRELIERVERTENISVLLNTEVAELGGGELLSEIMLKNTLTGETKTVSASPEDGLLGCFCFTGQKTTGMLDGLLKTENGYICTDEKMATSISGVFAAGDVRVTPLRQVVTACADGAVAAMQCEKYINI